MPHDHLKRLKELHSSIIMANDMPAVTQAYDKAIPIDFDITHTSNSLFSEHIKANPTFKKKDLHEKSLRIFEANLCAFWIVTFLVFFWFNIDLERIIEKI